MITGRLIVELRVDAALDSRLISEEVVVSSAGLKKRMLIPLQKHYRYASKIDLLMTFRLTDGRSVKLPQQTIFLNKNPGEYSFIVCGICHSGIIGNERNRLFKELRLTKLAPLKIGQEIAPGITKYSYRKFTD